MSDGLASTSLAGRSPSCCRGLIGNVRITAGRHFQLDIDRLFPLMVEPLQGHRWGRQPADRSAMTVVAPELFPSPRSCYGSPELQGGSLFSRALRHGQAGIRKMSLEWGPIFSAWPTLNRFVPNPPSPTGCWPPHPAITMGNRSVPGGVRKPGDGPTPHYSHHSQPSTPCWIRWP
jgi:hypothetical protein